MYKCLANYFPLKTKYYFSNIIRIFPPIIYYLSLPYKS